MRPGALLLSEAGSSAHLPFDLLQLGDRGPDLLSASVRLSVREAGFMPLAAANISAALSMRTPARAVMSAATSSSLRTTASRCRISN